MGRRSARSAERLDSAEARELCETFFELAQLG